MLEMNTITGLTTESILPQQAREAGISLTELLQTGKIKNGICPNCKNRDDLEYRVYGGISRILIVPTAPLRRITKVFCNSCQKEFNLKDLSDDIKQAVKYERSKNPIKTPIWQFTGIIILLTILAFGIYTGIEMTKLEKEYVKSPLKNDIYKTNIKGEYSTLKVYNVTKDSVYILLNKFSLDSYKGLEEINIEENYSEIKVLSKKELQKLYDENLIYEVNRE